MNFASYPEYEITKSLYHDIGPKKFVFIINYYYTYIHTFMYIHVHFYLALSNHTQPYTYQATYSYT